MTTALVTGVAGFIGSHLAEALLDRGWKVRGLDNLSTGDEAIVQKLSSSERFTFIRGDVADPAVVSEALADTEYVFHQAALSSVPQSIEQPRHTTSANCLGTATLLEQASVASVKHVVVASSAAVYESGDEQPLTENASLNPDTPYALSKYYTEKLARQVGESSDLRATALRYFNVYGPRQDPDGPYAAVVPAFLSRMQAGDRPVIYGDGEQSRDFVYISDVVDANVRVVEMSTEGVFNIASGERTTINELFGTIEDVLDTGLDPRYEEERPGDIRHSWADTTKAKQIFNYQPDVDLSDGIERTVAAMTDGEDDSDI